MTGNAIISCNKLDCELDLNKDLGKPAVKQPFILTPHMIDRHTPVKCEQAKQHEK